MVVSEAGMTRSWIPKSAPDLEAEQGKV
jgi:hypothetical protein